MIPITGAAFRLVPRYSVPTTFDSCGEPGRHVMEKVDDPAEKQIAVRCLGRFASWNIINRIGATAKITTNRLTPLYVRTPTIRIPTNTTCLIPNQSTILYPMDVASPDTSINFAYSADATKSSR